MALTNRLDKLEQRTGAGDCPVCSTDGPYDVVLCWSGDASAPTGPEYCPACGRLLVFTVTWGDDDASPRAS